MTYSHSQLSKHQTNTWVALNELDSPSLELPIVWRSKKSTLVAQDLGYRWSLWIIDSGEVVYCPELNELSERLQKALAKHRLENHQD
jgi:hypothetical protein